MEKPLIEVVDEREFTDRRQELAFLWNLVEKAKKRIASSYAIISRKGVGKTALLMRFYNELFTQQDEVAPFYISFAEYRNAKDQPQLTLKLFIEKLFRTFVRQYITFKLRVPEEVSGSFEVEELRDLVKQFQDERITKEFNLHVRAMKNDIEAAFDQAVSFVYFLTHKRGEVGMVIIDEFQVLTSVYDERIGKTRDITEWFQKPAEARWCPMVVSGSAVSLVTRTVFGGLLARRFGPYYLEPFTIEYTVEYVFRFARFQGVKVTEEVASQIHHLTGGNPYYVWCLMNSFALEDNDLSTTDRLMKIYAYEMENADGRLRGFWATHFRQFTEKINSKGISFHILYHLATQPKEEVNIRDIGDYVGVDWREASSVMDDLEQADLIERRFEEIYLRIKDPVLADFVKKKYETVMEGKSIGTYMEEFKKEFRRKIGSLSRLLGEVAELYTRHLLLNFEEQEVDSGQVFGTDEGMVKLPRFSRVEHRGGLVIKGDIIEFDLMAQGEEEDWLVEVKYWREPLPLKEVERFLQKLRRLKGWGLPLSAGKGLWVFAKGGFEEKTERRLTELGIRHSDLRGFNSLCRAVGIGEVPGVEE